MNLEYETIWMILAALAIGAVAAVHAWRLVVDLDYMLALQEQDEALARYMVAMCRIRDAMLRNAQAAAAAAGAHRAFNDAMRLPK